MQDCHLSFTVELVVEDMGFDAVDNSNDYIRINLCLWVKGQEWIVTMGMLMIHPS